MTATRKDSWAKTCDPVAMFGAVAGGFDVTNEWALGDDVDGPSHVVDVRYRGPIASNRKLRLFACGCCLLRGVPAGRVQVYERDGYSYGVNGGLIPEPVFGEVMNPSHDDRVWARGWLALTDGALTQLRKADLMRELLGDESPVPPYVYAPCKACDGKGGGYYGDGVLTHVDHWECDACGGLGRVAPAWLTPDVVGLAEAVYKDRAGDGAYCPGLVGILADALEDARCDLPGFVTHLRGPRPLGKHYPGCWVIDRLLGLD